MPDNLKNLSYRLGAVCYVIWGLLHCIAASNIYQLATSQEAGLVHGRLNQAAWHMLYLALFSIVVAVVFNWKNSWLGYWLNLLTVSVTDIGFVWLMMLPGYSDDILGPIMWILGAILTSIGIRYAPRQP